MARRAGRRPRPGAGDCSMGGQGQARVGVVLRIWRFGDGRVEELLPLGRSPRTGEGSAAAGIGTTPVKPLSPRDVGPRRRESGARVYWPWYLFWRAVWAKRRRQTNSRRHSKCPLLNHLRCVNQRRNELITGNQNANTDPPEVANKLITPTNSNPGSGGNPD